MSKDGRYDRNAGAVPGLGPAARGEEFCLVRTVDAAGKITQPAGPRPGL